MTAPADKTADTFDENALHEKKTLVAVAANIEYEPADVIKRVGSDA